MRMEFLKHLREFSEETAWSAYLEYATVTVCKLIAECAN